jgi:hypothetical protein
MKVKNVKSLQQRPNFHCRNTTLQAARGMIAHSSGKQSVDEQIAMGYLHVNTGTNEQFVSTISHLLSVYILSPYTV